MIAKDILNADMTTVARWLREGFRWWLTEIAELVPEKWRGSLVRRVPSIADLRGDTVVPRQPAGAAKEAATPGKRRATLVLPPGAMLMREIELPVVAGHDVKRMIALDIDRLTPFRAADVLFDIVIGARDAAAGRQRIEVAAVSRVFIESTLAHAREQGFEPVAISAERGGEIRYDFLAALRRTSPASAKRARMWWGVAAALAAANVLMLVYRDEAGLDDLRQTVESQEAPAMVADRLRRKVDAEALRRAAIVEQARHTPLSAFAAVTAALPDTAWVQRFEWNGGTVHVTGWLKGPGDVVRLFDASPVLSRAHALTTNHPASANGVKTFDVAADVRAEPGR